MKTKVPLPQGDEKKQMVQEMFDDIAPTYEKTNRIISFGLDKKLRKLALKELRAKENTTVLDFASGTGDFTRMLTSTNIKTISCDLSFGMLDNGREIGNPIQCDGTKLPLPDECVDGVVCGYSLRNFVDLQDTFDEIFRVLKPGSRFVAIDVTVPKNPLVKFFNQLWFAKTAPKLGWLISKNKGAYEYLPRSTSYLPGKDVIAKQLKVAGGENISISPLVFDSLILICATKTRNSNEN